MKEVDRFKIAIIKTERLRAVEVSLNVRNAILDLAERCEGMDPQRVAIECQDIVKREFDRYKDSGVVITT